jgi:hypothetical protein
MIWSTEERGEPIQRLVAVSDLVAFTSALGLPPPSAETLREAKENPLMRFIEIATRPEVQPSPN